MKFLFTEKGKPFFSIGGQVNNSSNYNPEDIERSFAIAKTLNLNTIAIPFYWNAIEPTKDHYDVSMVEKIIKSCEKNHLKLAVIWFGAWKNGTSTFTPDYIKENKETYWPVYTPAGLRTPVLAPFCEATKKRDALALSKLVDEINRLDKKGVVIGYQIENEIGSIGSPRDYSPKGEEYYHTQVPKKVIELVKKDTTALNKSFVQNGSKEKGDWGELFGFDGAEIFMSYHFAEYVNAMGKIVKEKTNHPTYINSWLTFYNTRIPGYAFPSGGPSELTMSMFKGIAKNIDAIAPDLYTPCYEEFLGQAAPFRRDDNIFFIPESYPASDQYHMLFKMIKEANLTGIHSFGIDILLDENGQLNQKGQDYKKIVNILNNSKELLEKYLGTDNFISVFRSINEPFKALRLGEYSLKLSFFNKNDQYPAHLDAQHRTDDRFNSKPLGFVFKEPKENTFYVIGQGFQVLFTKMDSVERAFDAAIRDAANKKNTSMPFLEVSEGTYKNGKFTPVRYRNGDETDFGTWVSSDVGVVRIRLL